MNLNLQSQPQVTFGLYTNIVSPHQLPLAREIVKRVGAENYRYIYSEPFHAERADMGWNAESEPWIIPLNPQPTTLNPQHAQEWLENCDVLLCCPRDLDLIERRCLRGLKTYYTNERWFKPISLKIKIPLSTSTSNLNLPPLLNLLLPGCLRLLHPRYFRMVRRFVKLVKKYDSFRLLPIGIHAYNDFLRMGVPKEKMTIWGYFVAPAPVDANFCSRPQQAQPSAVHLPSRPTFPIPQSNNPTIKQSNNPLRVLYVGRLIPLKRVDTIIRAVALANERAVGVKSEKFESGMIHSPTPTLHSNFNFTLTIVGDGPEKSRLQALTRSFSASIKNQPSAVHLNLQPQPISNQTSTVNLNLQPQPFIFLPSVPISSVRALMRQHDVLVFASNAEEGWGAVVSEALEEGLIVLGSNQSGAAATILPKHQRFDCGDYKRLAELLGEVADRLRPKVVVDNGIVDSSHNLNLQPQPFIHSIGEWSAARAAERIVSCAL